MSQGKYWCFTLNNPESNDAQRILSLVPEKASYIVIGNETGESGTPHLQGYVEFTKRLRGTQVSLLLGQRCHNERRKGSSSQAATYCKKDGNFLEKGEISISQQGKRTDISAAIDAARGGATIRDLWQQHPEVMLKYHRGMKEAVHHLRERSPRPTFELSSFRWELNEFQVTILWGAPGIGKTEFARALLPNALLVSHIDDLGRFDETYEGIIFDDMCFLHMPRTAQIHLVDWTIDRSIHIRYGTATIPRHTKKLFITNEEGGRIFELNDGAIKRRLNILHLE